jgi:YD repeat-containing protein
MMRTTGTYTFIGNVECFIPLPLPPAHPPLIIEGDLLEQYGAAMMQLGKLNTISHRLPDVRRFVHVYVTKEALLSSEIEGIATTLLEIFTQEVSGESRTLDTQLTLNYVDALYSALALQEKDGVPLSHRVIKQAHKVLMGNADTAVDPGNFRRQSVRVGDLVPPPAPEVPRLMSELEQYIHVHDDMPPLIRAGLVHVQFETIHPFLDGNGRIGRMLIVLMLVEARLLNAPIIYPSWYFKKKRLAYFHALDRVRTDGDFEGWLQFFLRAIEMSSLDAYQRAHTIEQLERELQEHVRSDGVLGRLRLSAEHIIGQFLAHPVTSITEAARAWQVSYNTAARIIERAVEIGILGVLTPDKRNRLFCCHRYLDVLNRDQQP